MCSLAIQTDYIFTNTLTFPTIQYNSPLLQPCFSTHCYQPNHHHYYWYITTTDPTTAAKPVLLRHLTWYRGGSVTKSKIHFFSTIIFITSGFLYGAPIWHKADFFPFFFFWFLFFIFICESFFYLFVYQMVADVNVQRRCNSQKYCA